jgi:hypothetical protein
MDPTKINRTTPIQMPTAIRKEVLYALMGSNPVLLVSFESF